MTDNRPISVGQLLVMTEEYRKERVRALSPWTRTKLAHLASIGAHGSVSRALKHLDNGHQVWARDCLAHARKQADIAAMLTADDKDPR